MKFAHIADAHLGAFTKNPALAECNLNAFIKAMEKCMEEKVDFIIIAGDLFHNPVPDMSMVNRAVEVMRRVRDLGIRIYVVYGSHDFSGGTTSLLDVLSSAGVFVKVVKYEIRDNRVVLIPVEDPAGVKIVGIPGLTASREVRYFEEGMFDFENLKKVHGPKIFVFHTTVMEVKPPHIKDTQAVPVSSFPRGFDYYAGGHLHERIEYMYSGAPLVYPGALFGATYNDLDEGQERGFYIVEDFKPRYIPVKVCGLEKKVVHADGLSARELYEKLEKYAMQDHGDKVVIIKVKGTLLSGRVSDIDFHKIRELVKRSARDVLLNTYGLKSQKSIEHSAVGESVEEIENTVFSEIADYGENFPRRLFEVLRQEKKEGERKADFEQRIWKSAQPVIMDAISAMTEKNNRVRVDTEKRENPKSKVSKKSQSRKKVSLFDFGDGL
ncbi:MAG: DNA repair exonuclease [Euryarchaeota archaeon]|nr:DNA repair exonuclease [Euryarchaeota archaeon]